MSVEPVSVESKDQLEVAESGSYEVVPQEAKASVIDTNTPIPFKCWVILFISCMGVLMASVSTTALIIIFPTLLIDLDASISTVLYILIVLMLVVASVVGIAGKLGDIFGQAILYKFGLFLFTLGSFIAGFADKEYQGTDLLGARCVIGLGGAFLFTNSSAILTNAFAPYNKVGLSQGIFQISSAAGMVLGPVLGGGIASTNWRWVFFWNVPLGGICFLLSLWAVQEQKALNKIDWIEVSKKMDWIGCIFYPAGLVLVFIAMLQAVAGQHNLDTVRPLAGLITSGVLCLVIFIVNEFYAIEPLYPPELFLKNRIFSTTTIAGAAMAFVRNSITYNFIFYLQGPKGQSPLQAGISLIPFGGGVMAAGLLSGFLSDKISPGRMSAIGCCVTLIAVICFVFFDQYTSWPQIEGLLFLAGVGVGIFGSPNNMSMMLSVEKHHRGVAAATSMFTLMCTSMIGIVLTFSFVLNSMSKEDLFALFIYGGTSLSKSTLNNFLKALQSDYYIVIACCAIGIVCALRNNIAVAGKSAPPTNSKVVDVDVKNGNVELVNIVRHTPEEATVQGEGEVVTSHSQYDLVSKEEV